MEPFGGECLYLPAPGEHPAWDQSQGVVAGLSVTCIWPVFFLASLTHFCFGGFASSPTVASTQYTTVVFTTAVSGSLTLAGAGSGRCAPECSPDATNAPMHAARRTTGTMRVCTSAG